MSTFYIANLLEKLPQIPTTRMVHNAICVWLAWDGELDPGVLRPLDEKQGVGNQYLGVIMPMRL